MRLVVISLLVCAGCDLIIPLDPPEPGACGPYGTATEVMIDPALGPLVGFSADGDRALARTTDVSPRLMTLKFDGAMWVADPMYQTNLVNLEQTQRLNFGHLSFEDTVFGAVRDNTPSSVYRVYELTFNGMWILPSEIVAFTDGQSVLPGGSLHTGAGTFDEFWYHVTTQSAGDMRSLVVIVKSSTVPTWRAEAVSGLLSTAPINQFHDVTHAAIALSPALGRPALVYAAKVRNASDSSDLYVSQKRQGSYELGIPIEGLSTADDELEPAVSENCDRIYFRRGEKIFQAQALPR
jgi:hypothetical protein